MAYSPFAALALLERLIDSDLLSFKVLDPNSPWLKSAPLLKSFDAENVSS
jgi:hypothetical protein